jgi:hypothetical protein
VVELGHHHTGVLGNDEVLEKKGISRKKALRMIERLEVSSAVASGAALHAMLYSPDSAESRMRLISKLIAAVDRV